MEWNLKAAASWDFSTLDDEEAVAFANMNTDGGVGSTSGLGTNKVGFSVDLKLGQVVDLGKDGKDGEGLIKMTSSTSPSGSSKRARGGGNNAGQAVSCLVDGCYSDLSHCRDYHRRHKVCELHSKTPEAIISGHKQRFCQQCSRFHSLDEFDEGKRSCRKRLDGHNRRRRKPQLDPLSRTGPILPHYQGSQMLPFSNSHVYPSTKVVNHAWPGVVNSEGNLKQQINLFDKQKYILGSSPGVSSCYKVGQQLTFLQVDNPRPNDHQSAVGQAAPMKTIAFPENDGENSSKMLYERSSRFARPIPEADCALSLLSSTQTQTQSSGIGLSLLDTIDSAQVSSISSASADVSLSGMFYHHLGYDAGGGNLSPPPPPPTLPFHWE